MKKVICAIICIASLIVFCSCGGVDVNKFASANVQGHSTTFTSAIKDYYGYYNSRSATTRLDSYDFEWLYEQDTENPVLNIKLTKIDLVNGNVKMEFNEYFYFTYSNGVLIPNRLEVMRSFYFESGEYATGDRLNYNKSETEGIINEIYGKVYP